MILNYTNNQYTFLNKMEEILQSISKDLDQDIKERIVSLSIYRTYTEEGYIFYIEYMYDVDTIDHLQENLLSVRLYDKVRNSDLNILEQQGIINLCLILNTLEDVNCILDMVMIEKAQNIRLVIETDQLDSIEDIMLTQSYSDFIGNTCILSLCSVYVSDLKRLEKPAFYTYLATLCIKALNMDTTNQIFLDFDVDIKLLKNYIYLLSKSSPSDRRLNEILITN